MTYDPTDIDGQLEARGKIAEQEKHEIVEEESDVKWLMSSEKGRRIVYRFLKEAGVFRTSFSTNALTMAHNEGRRAYGLKLLSIIQSSCYELYQPMIKEALNDRSSDN